MGLTAHAFILYHDALIYEVSINLCHNKHTPRSQPLNFISTDYNAV